MGETVALTPVPDAGYRLGSLTVKDENGGEITVAEDHTFTMPAGNVTVTATFETIVYGVGIDENIENGEVSADNGHVQGAAWHHHRSFGKRYGQHQVR